MVVHTTSRKRLTSFGCLISKLGWYHSIAIGILKAEPKVWSCNGIGVVVAIYYCMEFVKKIPKQKASSIMDASTPTLPGSVRQHVQGVTAVILGTLLLAIFKPFTNTTNLLGNIAVLFCILMFASPLSVIKVVIATKSAKAIPLPFTLISCVNCFMWVVSGWFEMNDVNFYFPNLLGLTSGLVQVALKLMYGDNNNIIPVYSAASITP